MKKLLIVLIYLPILLSSPAIFAQTDSAAFPKAKLSYGFWDMGMGESISLDRLKPGILLWTGANFIFSSDWGASLSITYNGTRARELPSDYHAGLNIFQLFPADELISYSLRLLRDFPTSSKLFRFGLEGGPSVVEFRKAYFTLNPSGGWFSSNYNTFHTLNYSVGLSLKAKAEFPLTRLFGLELAARAELNEYLPYLGAEVHMNFGVTRKR